MTDNYSNPATKRSFKPIVFDLKEGVAPKKMREEQTAPSRLDRRRSSSLTDSKNNTANDENLDDSFSIDLGGDDSFGFLDLNDEPSTNLNHTKVKSSSTPSGALRRTSRHSLGSERGSTEKRRKSSEYKK